MDLASVACRARFVKSQGEFFVKPSHILCSRSRDLTVPSRSAILCVSYRNLDEIMDYREQYCDTYTVFENTASYSTYTVYDDDVYARPDNSYEALALRHYM